MLQSCHSSSKITLSFVPHVAQTLILSISNSRLNYMIWISSSFHLRSPAENHTLLRTRSVDWWADILSWIFTMRPKWAQPFLNCNRMRYIFSARKLFTWRLRSSKDIWKIIRVASWHVWNKHIIWHYAMLRSLLN
jgi:hypothetical protein